MALETVNGLFDEAGLYIGTFFHQKITILPPSKVVTQVTEETQIGRNASAWRRPVHPCLSGRKNFRPYP
jgi:hypothetical protein